ncbi:hypothetical protein BX070DRAFT_224686 [Coemansia spiralis]|nr:hypothetical protein BX070DRAFT_224686 [Coemansia spiralis]
MQAYFKFQTLPLHIAEQIFNYIFVYPDSRIFFNGYDAGNTQTLSALYNTSQLWRTIALQYSCNLIKLTLSAEKGECSREFPSGYTPIEDKFINSLKYVEDVWIEINRLCLCDIHSGLQLLNCAWPGSNIFPSARRVKIEYYDDECEYDDSNSVEADHGTVFAILKQTFIQMPKLEEAYIDYIVRFGATEDYKPESAIAHRIDSILTMTIPKVKKLNINGIGLWAAKSPLCMYENAGLAYLELHSGYNEDILQHIVKRNAATLNALIFYFHLCDVAQDLLFDDEDRAVTYPRLEKLVLQCHLSGIGMIKQNIDKSVVPFPALKRLCWYGIYPFVDDTLFRKNSNTLTHLTMEANKEFIQIAQQHNIFHKASHPALRHITSIRHRDYYTREYVESQLYLQFTLGLVSTTTQTLELNRQGDIPIFLSAIPEYPRMENIQVLRIFRVNLTLSEIINLVKLLPMLAYLESGFKGLGEEIEKIDYDDLPEHLYSLYYPLSVHFKRLCASVHIEHYKHFAVSAILLAIICPRFIFIPTDEIELAEYFEQLDFIISTKPFSNYAEQVQHLFKSQVPFTYANAISRADK